ncbi:MAG: hypothetical protein HYY50_02190 [Candidatus Kerfeldbacteria bacterium]|nr:hypothetical protein [Candidatus Kerfeldbacteria bacterium]
MAIHEIQTAAIRLVYLQRPTEHDVAGLRTSLRLHPLDVEELLGFPRRNVIRPFRDQLYIASRWPAYEPLTKELRAVGLQLVVGPGLLVLVDDGACPTIQSFVDSLMQPAHPLWQASSAAVMAGLLLAMARWTEQQVNLFAKEIVTSHGDRDRIDFGQSLETVSRQLASLEPLLMPIQTNEAEVRLSLRLAVHRCRHQAAELLRLQRQPTRQLTPILATRLPRLVGGYAVASAVVVLIMLFLRS